jgi:histone deacetylase 1/2
MHTPIPILITEIQPALFPPINDTQTAEPHSSHPSHEATTRYPILTRSQHGVVKSNPKYALTITSSPTISREPNNIKVALLHPGWKATMDDELTTLHHNDTWRLVPHTPDMHVIGSKWVFKTKLKPDGTLDRLKARLVAKGYHQIDGIDYIEMFSPVIKPGTIRIILTIALVKHWPIHQLDVKNAFLHGNIMEYIYMTQPPGMADQQYLMHVCKLQRALYGLKHAPRAWFDRLSDFLISYGFFYSFVDPSLFVFHSAHGILALLLYVDDMLLTGSSAELVNSFIHIVSCEFSMKDL